MACKVGLYGSILLRARAVEGLHLNTKSKRNRATARATARSEGASPDLELNGVKTVGRELGRTLRRLRDEQDLPLTQVALRADISPAMLSRLETGAAMPSLETLVALASALGVSLPFLFRDTAALEGGAQLVQSGHGLEVVRRGTRKRHTYHLLAAQRGPRKSFEPFLVTLTDKSEVFPEFQHPGTEFIYILAGTLTYRHGTQSYPLAVGDALTFRGDVPHGPEKLGTVPIRMLSIIIYDDAPDLDSRV